MSLEKVTLDNGLTIYNDRIPGSYTNDVTMFVPYGSVNEESGDEGVAHAFEHCVHLQTDQFDDRADLRGYAQRNGMVTNASTYYTRTLYYANGLDLEPNINHLSQILQHTHFPNEAVEHEMKAVRREAATNLDDADRAHAIASTHAMFNYPYGRSVIGYHDKLDFDADKLKQLHERYYKLGRMSLLVSGMAKLDDVVTLANRYFDADDTPFSGDTDVPAAVFGEHKRTGLVRDDSENVRLMVGYPMNPEFRDYYLKNELAFDIGMMAVRDACFQTLRYEKGISYNGGASTATFNHPNAWSINGYVTTDKEHIDTAVQTFADIFSRDGSHYSDNAIIGSLAMYKYYFNSSLTSPDDHIDMHTSRLASYREPVNLRTTMNQLKKTSVADVRAAIDQLVDYTSTAPQCAHLTGKRASIGEVDKVIDRNSFS